MYHKVCEITVETLTDQLYITYIQYILYIMYSCPDLAIHCKNYLRDAVVNL